MKYSELKNFTNEELSNFNYENLTLDKYELIAKAENASIQLPDDIQEKLLTLCTELNSRSSQSENLLPLQKLQTVGEVFKIFSYVAIIINNLNAADLGILFEECLNAIISLLS